MRLAEVLQVSWPRAELANMIVMYAGFLFFRIIPNTRVTWKYFQLLLNARVVEKKSNSVTVSNRSNNNGDRALANGGGESSEKNTTQQQHQQQQQQLPSKPDEKKKSVSLTMSSLERNVMRVLFLFLASATGLNWYWFLLINRKAWELLFPANSVVSRVASESASTLAVNVAKQC
jgi:hypothetical protein